MSPIGSGEVSLTKHYRLDALVNELAQVKPGMTYNQVRSVLTAGGHAHAELADDLVTCDDGRVVDDEMLRACRAGRHDARQLVWVALVLADPRLARTRVVPLVFPQCSLVLVPVSTTLDVYGGCVVS